MFGATEDRTDAMAFARRGLNHRHHFRFIVLPEDTAEMADLKAFTRDLVTSSARRRAISAPGLASPWEHRHPRLHPVVRGVADDGSDPQVRRLAVGRLQKLERMGLATAKGRANECSVLKPSRSCAPSDAGQHRAFTGRGQDRGIADYVTDADTASAPISGCLVATGLRDELTGEAYAMIDGTDGRAHHVRLRRIEAFAAD